VIVPMFDLLTQSIPLPAIALVVLVLLPFGLGLVIWSMRSHRDPKLQVQCDAPVSKLLPSLSGLTQGTVYEGNTVEIFENGAFFEMMFEEIAAARSSVHFETFLWKEGRLGARLVEALVERQRAGVTVRVLVDANGGKKMGTDAQERLRAASCKLVLHHPTKLRHIGVFNERDHRKLAVIDGQVALVGGHCIVDSWLGNAENKDHVRDLAVRLRGPVVHAVQSAFSENWVEDTGELFVGDAVFPPLDKCGEVPVHVASIKAEGSPPAVKILHHLVVCVAQKRIRIQNPYFLPDDEAIAALCQAVKRGVDVRVMVPSTDASDMPLVQHAAHRNFHKLLDGGVRIFEYQTCLLHQKVMTVDGSWCAIGSSNFDDRSFETNDEITLSLCDEALARRFEAIFEHDARQCVELQPDTWARRGLWPRCRDNVLHVFNEVL
jgi:cardiolipin synthase